MEGTQHLPRERSWAWGAREVWRVLWSEMKAREARGKLGCCFFPFPFCLHQNHLQNHLRVHVLKHSPVRAGGQQGAPAARCSTVSLPSLVDSGPGWPTRQAPAVLDTPLGPRHPACLTSVQILERPRRALPSPVQRAAPIPLPQGQGPPHLSLMRTLFSLVTLSHTCTAHLGGTSLLPGISTSSLAGFNPFGHGSVPGGAQTWVAMEGLGAWPHHSRSARRGVGTSSRPRPGAAASPSEGTRPPAPAPADPCARRGVRLHAHGFFPEPGAFTLAPEMPLAGGCPRARPLSQPCLG